MRRLISVISALVAVGFLALVLADATLVDRRPPSVVTVTLSATAGDERIAEPITSINVQFSEAIRTETAEPRFHIQPDVSGTISWDGGTLIFTPSEPLPPATDFVVRVDPGFVDRAGNVGGTGLDGWAFTTAGPPRVLAVTPADGSAGLPLDMTVELRFDRLMDTPSVESAIRVDPPVAFRPTWAGEALALAFDPGLRFGTTYTLTVDPAATDTGGAHLSEPFVTHFSTVSAGLASTVVPADGVAGIAVRSPIAVEFDGPIEPDSIADALSITPAVAGDAEVVPRSDGSGASTLVFTPSSPLAEHTTYTVSLASGVHRLGDPSQVAAARTWSFTTGSPTASAQNQIAFLSDRSGVRNVWLVNPDGTNARQLTWELAPVTTFDVTGDGRRLTFGAGDVVGTLNVDGDDRRILTDDGFHEFAPRLSPDETAILLSRRDPTGADLGWWSVPTPWTFGDERQVLVAGAPELDGDAPDPNSQPAFDTSGRYAIVSAGGELVVLDLAPSSGGSVIAVRTGVAPAGTPAWSASASAFAAVGLSARDDVSRVQLIGLDGTVTTIAGTDKATEALTVDEHGRLAFVIDQGGAGRWIQLLDPASGRSVELTSDADLIDAGPAFSPDGRRVVFARSRRDPYESAGLWLIDLESRVVTRLTIDGSEPRWLP